MPVPLRTAHHKAEAKYNVTTEFPSLGLHSAAATGNIGLVEYALDHGQPINSVLDGVLPLHAACAGGNVQVVQLLIDHGADVNAPRLPRRYSSDKNRDTSAPIVGTSGSTPLHFAAANGNTSAVHVLLLHGAHANRSDKHGITPEMLARQHGWLECAEVLKQWVINKDRDLRERPSGIGDDTRSLAVQGLASRERTDSFGAEGEPSSSSMRRRLQMKHSIDTALNRFKPSSDTKPQHFSSSTPPSSPSRAEYPSHPVLDETLHSSIDGKLRRPSLPHILQPNSTGPSRMRKTSTPSINLSPSPRRPRSAGAGAENQEQDQETPYTALGRPSGSRRLGSKYSLMNIFKKAQPGEPGNSVDGSQSILGPSSPPSFGSTTALPLSSSPNATTLLSKPSTSSTDLREITSTSNISISPFSLPGFRFRGGSDASTRALTQQSSIPQSIHRKHSATLSSSPRAVDLHNAIAQQQQERQQRQRTRDRSRSTGSGQRYSPEGTTKASPSPSTSPLTMLNLLRTKGHSRDRSGSGGSLGGRPSPIPGHRGGAVFDDDVVVNEIGDSSRPGSRPSILKVHNRTPSSGQSQGLPSSLRALRFDSSSSGGRGGFSETESHEYLRSSSSAGSLGGHRGVSGKGGLGSGNVATRVSEEDLGPESAPAAIRDFEDLQRSTQESSGYEDDEEDFEYGRPLNGDSFIGSAIETEFPLKARIRERGDSFASSRSSLSPILSNENTVEGPTSNLISSEFPFSINVPPPMFPDETEPSTQEQLLRVPSPADHRHRGDSVSSTSTTDSRNNPQLSASGTTSGSGGSDTVTTPWMASPGHSFLHLPIQTSPSGKTEGVIVMDDLADVGLSDEFKNETTIGPVPITGMNEKRPHIPPDININSISSHAQAEALVQKAQQDIFEMAHGDELAPGTTSAGRSPLSARLAAYGESLALERKLREQKEAVEGRESSAEKAHLPAPTRTEAFMRDSVATPGAIASIRDGVERQHSLEHKSGKPRSKSKMKDPRRPSTAEDSSSRQLNNSLSSDSTGRSHHSTRSTSGFERSYVSQDPNSSEEINSFSVPTRLPQRGQGPKSMYTRSTSRSRTPVRDMDHGGQLSRISSLDCPDTDTELGPPLFRVSTAPLSGPSPSRGKREVKSASKLTRMGFSPVEQAGRAPVVSRSKRFEVIRSIVQTLKGKT
ncbi:hypothetical protein BDZ94DRAFT_1194532 [Collybia nuda]|uniref:Ankyrin repeat protein n=1 Tax=Collybia nuda TaxID=64659 RepID=A0A9P5Y521_9AGAR|nr:hypothetical protein BDZ94DRAFT_1194532 [Collybia nuda]